MYKILCVAGRDKVRFNQYVQIESMRFDTLEYAKKAVEILSSLFTETVFELLDLDEYEESFRESKCDYCNCALRDCSLCGSDAEG